MLCNILFYLFICVISSKVCLCERRITNGKVVATEKKYMVYIVNSLYSDNQPESWVCGGVLISTLHVLTAAACLSEVSHMYVIAGYKKYVNGKNIMNDPCTATRKQRIVKVIIPKAYNETSWMRSDVGIGVVQNHYDFLDASYYVNCSYSPEHIPISYDRKLESAGGLALALGWGAAYPRKPGMAAKNKDNINSEYLMETRAIIGNNSFCQLQFPQEIEYLFLCTYASNDVRTLEAIERSKKEKEMTSTSTTKKSKHTISSTTKNTLAIKTTTTFAEGTWRYCTNIKFNLNNEPEECLDDVREVEVLKRRALVLDSSNMSSDEISIKNETFNENKSDSSQAIPRAQETNEENYGGICQNDHGGPLVALVGQQERLIGIALNSVYSKEYQCNGPSLYLSTARAKALIKCLLASKHENYYVPERCKAMNFEVKKYNVNWPACADEDCKATTWMSFPQPSVRPVHVKLMQPLLLKTTIPPKKTIQPKIILLKIEKRQT